IFQREGGYLIKKIQNSNDNLFTFSFSNNINALHYYIQINFKIILIGIFSLYFIKNKVIGISFWLWMIIPLIFHSFLIIYHITPLRYVLLLFPCIYLAAGSLLGSSDRRFLYLFIPFVLANFILVAPECPGTYAPIYLGYKWHFIIPVASVITAWILSRYIGISKDKTICFTAFMFLFICGQWWILFLGLLVYPLYLMMRRTGKFVQFK
ncbi:MAG: hypothetical protein WAX69_09060, partial [Victivallales bacterium]